jgi:hypothetical protein
MSLGSTSYAEHLSFEEDGIHLTKNSGFNFVEGTLEAADAVFRASVVDLDERAKKKSGYSGLSVVQRLKLMRGDGTTT